ncbi:MAG TPA: thioredoxin domain-containing protein [Candidatus Limnocylindria bacterium]|nr:thioredoxin domain-containing protein [Candidatus Limnocylindria bacterium]
MRSAVLVLAAAVMAWGCGATPQDVDELKKNQKDILAKLEALATDVKAVASRPAAPARPDQDPNKVYDIPVGDSPVKGPKDAKVKIVEFSDYQCPFCSQADSLIAQVLEKNPDVAFVYKQFPLTSIHPQAMGASKAALAAGKQGKYWEYHELLFKNQRQLSPEKFKEFAQQLGLDVAKWERDMNSKEVADQVSAEMQQATAADVRGTPTIFVNGKRAMSRTPEAFQLMIDQAKGKG